ncbi:alpha-E domain-containing protein [Streptomyces sp. NPDC017435]|uniref:alpha-E domain-containing protein n=1 Tax=Streptomyces sp. NPDC017435 TaxID=3364995 RepID=UPI003789F4E8
MTSRGDSRRLAVPGRSLERVDMTVRLPSVRFPDAARAHRPILLSGSGADEAYARVRRFRRTPGVAGFLLPDREFPHSAPHAPTTARECLGTLGRPAPPGPGTPPVGGPSGRPTASAVRAA